MVEAPRKIEGAADGLDQLKSLLFRGETRRLDEIERTVDHLDQRVGDAPRLERATAEVIVEALRRAEVARHRELADAIAPVVVAAIRNEIKNSREMMVEALYPLTGQLVVAAVQNAFRELMDSLNQRLNALTSVDRWKLQARARLTGRPVSELMVEQAQRGRVVRMFFLENGSGRLIESWRADEREDDRADMVGGLIAALTGFARDALDAGANELRTLDLGGRKTYLRSSPQTIFAAEIEGELTSEQIFALDRAFLALISSYGRDGAVDDDMLRDFAEQVDDAAAAPERRGFGMPLKIAAALLMLLVFAFAWRGGARWWQERNIEAAVAEVVRARPHLAAFPLRVVTDHSRERVELMGLAPSGEDAEALVAALKQPAGRYAVGSTVALTASTAGLATLEQAAAANARDIEALRASLAVASREAASAVQLAQVRAEVERLAAAGATAAQVMAMQARLEAIAGAGASQTQVEDLRARVEDVARSGASASIVSDLRARIEALAGASAETRRLGETVAALSQSVAALTARAATPRARLAALTEGYAVFFTDNDVAIDEARYAQRFDAIAALLKESDLTLRVVGHTDASGNAPRNVALSRRRAEAIADLLAARGAPRNRLVVVGRGASVPITEPDATFRDLNRRVTFEMMFENEETR